MGDAHLMQILQYIDDLPYVKRDDLMVEFGEVFFEEVFEGSSLTEFKHKIKGLFILEWSIDFDDTGMVDLSEEFPFDHSLILFLLPAQQLLFDLFESELLICFLTLHHEHLAVGTLSESR